MVCLIILFCGAMLLSALSVNTSSSWRCNRDGEIPRRNNKTESHRAQAFAAPAPRRVSGQILDTHAFCENAFIV